MSIVVEAIPLCLFTKTYRILLRLTWCRRKWTRQVQRSCEYLSLTFIWRRIANIFAEYNQQEATFHNLFISVRRCTCFRRGFSVRHQELKTAYTDKYLTLYVQFCAPDDGRKKTSLKHVENLTEINWETLHLVGCTLRIVSTWGMQLKCDDLK